MNCPECGAESKVLGSKNLESMTVVYRRRVCQNADCGHRFSSVEVSAVLWASIKKAVRYRSQAIVNRRWINHRDSEIRRRIAAGEKQTALASEFDLAEVTISKIKRGLGPYGRRSLK